MLTYTSLLADTDLKFFSVFNSSYCIVSLFSRISEPIIPSKQISYYHNILHAFFDLAATFDTVDYSTHLKQSSLYFHVSMFPCLFSYLFSGFFLTYEAHLSLL